MQITVEMLTEPGFFPSKAHSTDAGFDLKATVDCALPPFEAYPIPVGFKMKLPEGYEAQIRARSGMSIKGLQVANAPGTIDSGYEGEVKAIMYNATAIPIVITRGQKIAQMVIQKLPEIELIEGIVTKESERGEDGFGSSGT